jgi:DNA-directed RNA polymerase
MDALTREAARRNLARSKKNADRMGKAFGASARPEYHAIAQLHLDRLSKFICEKLAFRPTSKRYSMKSLTTEVFDLVAKVPPEELAQAALDGTLNSTRAPLKKNADGTMEAPARAAKEVIGAEIERAVRGNYLQSTPLGEQIRRAAHRQSTLNKRLAVERKSIRKAALTADDPSVVAFLDRIPKWTKTQTIFVGNWGLDCCLQALPDIFVTRLEGRDAVPAIDEGAWETARDIAYKRMLNHPIWTPSLEEPKPWTSFENADGLPFLRNCRKPEEAKAAIASGEMRPHLDAINYLQGIAYKIDDDALDFLQEPSSRSLLFDVFDLYKPGNKGQQTAINADTQLLYASDWPHWDQAEFLRRSQIKLDLEQAEILRRRSQQTVLEWDLEQAEFLRGQTFWLPLSCDWRGRVVPIPYFHYGRGDHIRSLLRFARGAPINERGLFWLKVSTANCFNENKIITRKPFEDRVRWVDDNIDRIRKIAEDPRKYLNMYLADGLRLCKAAHPFQFLSHARELVKALDAMSAGREFITTLPLPLDGSNSAAQHYSLLSRDPKGAQLTNLIFDREVHCVYEEVGDILRSKLAIIIDEAANADELPARKKCGARKDAERAKWCVTKKLVDRKHTKPLVMTYFYNQSQSGQTKTLTSALAEKDADAEDIVAYKRHDGMLLRWPRKKDLMKNYPEGYVGWFVQLAREAIAKALPGAEDVKKFVSGVTEALAANERALMWTSPSGVPVCNEYREPDVHIKTTWLGASPKKHNHKVADGWLPELRQSKCKLAAPPNLIHSLDASHLAFVAIACEAEDIPLVTVHDAYATLGPYVDAMRRIWHGKLRDMYEGENMLQDIYDYARSILGPAVKLPEIPERRGLKLAEVAGPYGLG